MSFEARYILNQRGRTQPNMAGFQTRDYLVGPNFLPFGRFHSQLQASSRKLIRPEGQPKTRFLAAGFTEPPTNTAPEVLSPHPEKPASQVLPEPGVGEPWAGGLGWVVFVWFRLGCYCLVFLARSCSVLWSCYFRYHYNYYYEQYYVVGFVACCFSFVCLIVLCACSNCTSALGILLVGRQLEPPKSDHQWNLRVSTKSKPKRKDTSSFLLGLNGKPIHQHIHGFRRFVFCKVRSRRFGWPTEKGWPCPMGSNHFVKRMVDAT